MNKKLYVTLYLFAFRFMLKLGCCKKLMMDSISNDIGELCHYKTSLRGLVEDYIITFNELQCQIDCIVNLTYDLFEKLVSEYRKRHSFLKCRIVAKVNFIHVNEVTNTQTERSYYFASCKSENVDDALQFYQSHMLKIASRLESFHENGSNLIIKNIENIHIHLTAV